MPLDRENTRTIDRRGGTVLHSSRTNPSKMQKLPDHLAGKDFPVSLEQQERHRHQVLGRLRASAEEPRTASGSTTSSPSAATTR